jgi:hypothetical protein
MMMETVSDPESRPAKFFLVDTFAEAFPAATPRRASSACWRLTILLTAVRV